MRAAYLGPAGTNSHDALVAAAGDWEPLARPTVAAAVAAVQDGSAERALVPIENSREGGVGATLDALVFDAPDVVIVGELVHRVTYCLVAGEPIAPDEIRTVHSHPQATGQCAAFLADRLPGAAVVAAASTADAVRAVADAEPLAGDAPHAAIGPPAAARLYGAEVLAQGIEDDPENATRFAWLARARRPRRRPRSRRPAALSERGRGQDHARVLGRRRFGARLARRVPDGVLLARRQPDPDRVAAAPSRPRSLHVRVRPHRRRGRRRRGDRDRRAQPALRGGSGARLLPRRGPAGRLTRRVQRLHSGTAMATAVPPVPAGSVPLDHRRHGSGSDGSGRWSGGRVLVLNATYEPINVCTVRRATVLLLKAKAEVVEIGQHDLRWARGSMHKPVVIRLVTYVRIPRDSHKRKITRRAVFARDDWQCQYCGARTSLTVDHVIPRSKGGGSDWENIVASCAPCNRRKGDRLPHQVNMHPRSKPRMPSPNVFIQLASPTIPSTWRQYLLPEAA